MIEVWQVKTPHRRDSVIAVLTRKTFGDGGLPGTGGVPLHLCRRYPAGCGGRRALLG